MLAGERWPGENQEGQTRGPSNHLGGSGLYKWGARGAALGRRPMRKDTVEMRGPHALWETTGVQGSGRDRWRVAGRRGGAVWLGRRRGQGSRGGGVLRRVPCGLAGRREGVTGRRRVQPRARPVLTEASA